MSVLDDIRARRTAGLLHCGYGSGGVSLVAIASSFSLSPDPSRYRKVGKPEAIQVLTRLLHKDMAYNSEIMPAGVARSLSISFLQDFCDSSADFFTNIDFSGEGRKLGKSCWAGPDWKPVTKATFDAGVIAISPTRHACLWIEDED